MNLFYSLVCILYRVRVCNFRLQFTPIQITVVGTFTILGLHSAAANTFCNKVQNFVTIYDNKRFRKNIRPVSDAAPLIYKGNINVEKSIILKMN